MILWAGLLIILLILDFFTILLAGAEAWMLWTQGGKILRKIGIRDFCLAIEVTFATSSWFFYQHPLTFLSIRIIGRVIENAGLLYFLRFLLKDEKSLDSGTKG